MNGMLLLTGILTTLVRVTNLVFSRRVKESPSLIIDSKKFMNQLIESVFSTMIYHRSETPKM